jgi:RNA polymerase sigma-70 factor (ECF subfamily)
VNGDVDGLMSILAPGVTLVADGGGRVRAPLLPVTGADKVARFLVVGAARSLPDPRWRAVELNGRPGVLVTSEGRPVTAATFDLVEGRVIAIYLVANPDKLRVFAVDS